MKSFSSHHGPRFQIFSFSRRDQRRGITLIELMIAVVITLIIVAAMVRAFKLSSHEISLGRASMDMHNQMRAVTETLRRDLQNATCLPRPRGISDERSGYFEIVEGPEHDHDFTRVTGDSYLGDHDDILALTVRATDRPFRGRVDTSIDPSGFVESYIAEVIWFVTHSDTDGDDFENITLYRRVLLIRPDLTTSETDFDTFYANNDIAVRRDFETGALVMNSLQDLALRQNRYAHNAPPAPPAAFPATPQNFPHPFMPTVLANRVFAGDREGEDLMLANLTAFDVKVFSPDANVVLVDNETVEPNDIDFEDDTNGNSNPLFTASARTPAGSYVDLGGDSVRGWFSGLPFENNYELSFPSPTYCTWSAAYEMDGIDQDQDTPLIDEGADGVDNDGVNGVDDNGERETQPPYPYPIRSIQISLRMIEPNTNQMLQKTIKESFVPN